MPLEPSVPEFRPGQALTRDGLNAIRNEHAALQRHYAENFRQPGKPFQGKPPFVEHFIGIVTATPPDGSGFTTDFTDCRYFIDFAVPAPAQQPVDVFNAVPVTAPNIKQWVVATNLAELPLPAADGSTSDGTHTVPIGTFVHVFRFLTPNTTPAPYAVQHVFFHGSGGGGNDQQLQYQFMVVQAVSDNQMGGDFVRGHAMT